MSSGTEGRNGLRWIRADLHIHTPASEDYAEPDISYLDILQEAERRELELIAFTDHNTVSGYEQFQREIEFLHTLERAGRLTDDEKTRLDEYQRLLAKIMVLPGFEFTSHFGAHILGVFPPNRPLSLIEATLLQLGVPPDALKKGLCGVANTRHVTEAYEIIHRAGGLVIAPHVNGPNGVITETIRMGTSGQSRIAATQSAHLHALEFVNFYTDHEKFTSPGFYNGRTEHYERRMFCIQGSDAHRLRRLAEGEGQISHRHGIGDRYVELLLPDNSFDSLKSLFASQNFDRVRVPKRDQKQWAVDALRFGATSERQILRHTGDDPDAAAHLWPDVAALANNGGGVVVIGCEPGGRVVGVPRPDQVSEALRRGVQENLEPSPYLSLELMNYEGKDIVRVEVKAGELPPYMGKNGVVYVRHEGETVPASRGEVMQLCRRALAEGGNSPLDNGQELDLPRSGVEIVVGQKRGGLWLYEVRDLRTTAGVARDRAQGLWAYAISRHEDLRDGRVDLHSQVKWKGRLGLWRAYRQGNRTKYDLVHRDANGVIDHIFYGVSDWGLSEGWMALLSERTPDTVEQEPQAFDRDDDQPRMMTLDDDQTLPEPSIPWGDRRYRWRGRGGLWRITLDEENQPRFDLAMKDKDGNGQQEYQDVPLEKITEAWLNLVRVPRPRTGIEVVSASIGDDGEWQYIFRNLRTGDVSGVPWRLQDIEVGTVREYAARMYQQDVPLDESQVRWWGNIGYMRPMRSQVDLVYMDENGETHFYYAARREELLGEWRELLELYGEM
ncbi:MAG: putative DNA binding domain-containing protein [Chloroflexaceae bacterium]|jgi:hypothetical protein|nr:putative DNA binding domain-containing protein [Chloroflexaceae bacterium]